MIYLYPHSGIHMVDLDPLVSEPDPVMLRRGWWVKRESRNIETRLITKRKSTIVWVLGAPWCGSWCLCPPPSSHAGGKGRGNDELVLASQVHPQAGEDPPGGSLKLSSLVLPSLQAEMLIILTTLNFFNILLSLALPVLLLLGLLVTFLLFLDIQGLRSSIFLLLRHTLARSLLLLQYNAILRFINVWSYGEKRSAVASLSFS